MSAEATMVWAAKGAGATAGSAISLAYLLPKGPREALIRFAVGLTTGLVFGSTAGLWIAGRLDLVGELPPAEIALIGSGAASLSAWWALGALQRFAERIARDDGRRVAPRRQRRPDRERSADRERRAERHSRPDRHPRPEDRP